MRFYEGCLVMICTHCENEASSLNVLDDQTKICDACLLIFYPKCDKCGEFKNMLDVKFFTLRDGRQICEHCREDIADEDIDFNP